MYIIIIKCTNVNFPYSVFHMYICNTFAILKICELQKSALHMEKHCWILEKIKFSHLGRYSYWSVQNPLYSVAKFWFLSIIGFQWAIGCQKWTAGSWDIVIQQCLYVLPETCMSNQFLTGSNRGHWNLDKVQPLPGSTLALPMEVCHSCQWK